MATTTSDEGRTGVEAKYEHDDYLSRDTRLGRVATEDADQEEYESKGMVVLLGGGSERGTPPATGG